MKQLLISIALAGTLLVLSACKNDNGKEPDLESVFKVTPAELSFTKDGGTQELTLNVSNSWKAEVDAEWCTLSRYEGEKDEFIKVTAKASTSEKETLATIKFYDTRGNSVSVTVKRAGTGETPTPTPAGEKCKASDYTHVTIGTQTWMAENYRCSKYDTQSEAYNASWLTNNTIPTSEGEVFIPYYTDASDKSKWDISSKQYGVNLTDAQVAKLGYLYNWAAAVGVADGYDYGTKPFSGNRQGICPNGWHIPSKAEWQTLVDYIEKTDERGIKNAGKHLKTTSGWYSVDSEYKQGLDTYGFAALPAGGAEGSSVYSVGGSTYFWTATPSEGSSGYAYVRGLGYKYDYLKDGDDCKIFGRPVRCLKDSESPTPTPTPAGEKCNASDYPQVTIGSQTWMAENYRCSKYDTESEAYNASWLTSNTIPTSDNNTYTPYYTDASDTNKWDSYSKQYGVNLTDAQVKKLGYLYNWAAAVGIADGQKQTTAFSGNRQGICPNGWHVPSIAEWQTLYDYIYSAQKLTSNQVGKYLKTTSGWYSGDSYYQPGLDTYGFAALPAGYAVGSSVSSVGFVTYFWTGTPYESLSGSAYLRYLLYDDDYLGGDYNYKDYGQYVRCLRN